jgi:hypothetical protein
VGQTFLSAKEGWQECPPHGGYEMAAIRESDGGNKTATQCRTIVVAHTMRDNAVDNHAGIFALAWEIRPEWSEAMIARPIIFALMFFVLPVGSIVASEPDSDTRSIQDVGAKHRPLSAIQDDLHEALRAEALTRRQGQNASQVIRLVELYREMAAHPKRHDSRFLARMGLRLRSRLEKVRDHIEKHTAREDRNATKKDAPADVMAPETPALAQQVALPGGPAAPGGKPAGAGARAGAGGIIDYGPELVELIQATISPSTWDINGGNGSIVYFAPLRVIVVSAPSEVHGDVADVLGQLRAAP